MKLKTSVVKKSTRKKAATSVAVAKSPPPKPVHRGRQRCQVAEASILKAASDLLIEHSLRDVTAEAIAERAGVSKATIYKWWPNKNRVALDAFLITNAGAEVPIPNTGSVVRDFVEHLVEATRFYHKRLRADARAVPCRGTKRPKFFGPIPRAIPAASARIGASHLGARRRPR